MFGTTLVLALRSIRRHLLRSCLTTLGLVIGVAAVVTMVTLGNATAAAVQAQIANLGTNVLHLHPTGGFARGGGGPPPPAFKPADVIAIERQIAGVTAVAPQAQASAVAVRDGNNWSTTIFGMSNAYFTVQPWPLADGRIFTRDEEEGGKAVCIVGNTVRTKLFGEESPIGRRFRLGGVSCQVVGLLTPKGQAGFGGGDQDDHVIMPVKTVARRFVGTPDIRAMLVGVDAAYDSDQVKDSLSGLLRERRLVQPGQEDNFLIVDPKQVSETLAGATTLLTGVVTAVAAISLIVGGIGIMNIMLVSVTERTREIGIRLAIGALAHEVRMQFLVEAVVLSCLGGVIGLVVAQLAVLAIAPVMQVSWRFDPAINLVAFVVAAAIGVIFGFVPARRAAALNPIDALRHE
ncbi:ABC transporter permease [Sphingomonas sp. ac-8]|uniref:ABC transporter permease n=1 Tax=Sphingomonas sp. ac-8 TaxID=3242977 RepID=UPI003A7FAB29